MIIELEVKNKRIRSVGERVDIVADNGDYFLKFHFDGEWDGHIKTARLLGGKRYIDVVLDGDDSICIPQDIVSPPCLTVGVYGGGIRTTSPYVIKCDVSILSREGVPAAPSEDVYSQLCEICEKALATAEVNDERCDVLEGGVTELDGRVSVLERSESERCEAERERCLAERERCEQYEKSVEAYSALVSEGGSYSNAYLTRVIGESVSASGCVAPCDVTSFKIYGKSVETGQETKSLLTPSSIVDSVIGCVKVGDVTYAAPRLVQLKSLHSNHDVYDIVSGLAKYNIARMVMENVNGQLYANDEHYGRTSRAVSFSSYRSSEYVNTSCARVNKRSLVKYSTASKCLCTHFVFSPDAIDPQKARAGLMYSGDDDYVYFTCGQAGESAETALAEYFKEQYDNGTPVILYADYSLSYIEQYEPVKCAIASEYDVLSCKENTVEVTYRGDVNTLDPLYGKSLLSVSPYPVSWASLIAGESMANITECGEEGGCFAGGGLGSQLPKSLAGIDYIIFQGGIYDKQSNAPFGEISEDYGGVYDTTSFIGGLEAFCHTLVRSNTERKYGYIFYPYTSDGEFDDVWCRAIKEVLQKWCIPYLDLRECVAPIGRIDALKQKYTLDGDGITPNKTCIQRLCKDKITAWLRQL